MRVSSCRSARIDPPRLMLPTATSYVRAGLSGFPSPAEEFSAHPLDLNERYIPRPSSTFFVTVDGDSMEDIGIRAGDLLIVDRSITPRPGHVVVALIDGEMTVKRYETRNGQPYLISANQRYRPIALADHDHFIWGVVRSSVHNHVPA